MENLFSSWREFKRGKRSKADVQNFEFNLEDNLFRLHSALKEKTYCHSHYTPFNVCDPKLRRIHKAAVRDRVLHHAVFRVLYPIFDKSFIYDSYSCRKNKGTHRAVNRLKTFAGKSSKNNRQNFFALKLDVKKFFDSINQDILLEIIKRKIIDENTLWLIEIILKSFDRGLPLGNVTSQLFANIYLNELDRFVKHNIKARFYLRYCDDFIILGKDAGCLKNIISPINVFLKEKLKLLLHRNKIIIRKHHQGIDFLGYVVLPYHKVLRTKTKRRIIKKLNKRKQEAINGLTTEKSFIQCLQSYLGVLFHANAFGLSKKLKNNYLNPNPAQPSRKNTRSFSFL